MYQSMCKNADRQKNLGDEIRIRATARISEFFFIFFDVTRHRLGARTSQDPTRNHGVWKGEKGAGARSTQASSL